VTPRASWMPHSTGGQRLGSLSNLLFTERAAHAVPSGPSGGLRAPVSTCRLALPLRARLIGDGPLHLLPTLEKTARKTPGAWAVLRPT
jgi:hypothetical protein